MSSRDPDRLASIPCRLCGGEAAIFGRRTLRGRHDVAFFECAECGALQTGMPYWLEEAYQVDGLGLDVGACQRCVNLSIEVAACLAVLSVAENEPCLDFGSGLGLFARLMRDRGFDFRAYDKFIQPFFMDRFCGTLTGGKWSVITAFEVLEHMVSPGEELAELLAARPRMLLFTTHLWERQGLDWWYISPEGGQHIFFHTRKSLQVIAARHGYAYFDLKRVKLFLCDRLAAQDRPLSQWEKIAFRWNRFRWHGGADLPRDVPTQLQLLRDGKTMRRLGQHLFLKHQAESFRWANRDFAAIGDRDDKGA